MQIFNSKILMSVAFATVIFSGCGDEPEAPTPASSENNGNSRFTKDDEDNLTGNGFKKDIYGQDLLLNKLSATDKDGMNGSGPNGSYTAGELEAINSQFKPVYFDYDSYDVSDSMSRDIIHNVNILKKMGKGQKLTVEGNCDELGTDEYNYGLGLKRAKIVQDALAIEGFSGDSVKTVSYGESNPSCTEHNDDCWAKNRRVDFKLEQ